MLDLTTIPLPDLKALITVCGDRGRCGNRFFEDQWVILSRVALSSHELLEMSEYSDEDLLEACGYLQIAIDNSQHLPADHPGMMFLKYSATAAYGELQKRARKESVKAVK